MFSIASTPTTERINAVRNGESVAAFLDELDDKGVYRIGRVVTFLDNTYPRWFRDNAPAQSGRWPVLRQHGSHLVIGLFARGAQLQRGDRRGRRRLCRRNPVRLRASALRERPCGNATAKPTGSRRSIASPEKPARRCIWLDWRSRSTPSGVVSTAGNDQGIGHSVEGLAPYLDYISPMVYPSGWTPGSFGYALSARASWSGRPP